LKADTDNTVWC